jgi:putative endonuclease
LRSPHLRARVHQHREKLLPGFTKRYNVSKLVYYEAGYDATAAIAREKQIKAGSRQKKVDLINRLNPGWRDLYAAVNLVHALSRSTYPARDCFAPLAMTTDVIARRRQAPRQSRRDCFAPLAMTIVRRRSAGRRRRAIGVG